MEELLTPVQASHQLLLPLSLSLHLLLPPIQPPVLQSTLSHISMDITAAKLIKNFNLVEPYGNLRLALVMAKGLAEKVHAAKVMIIRSVHIPQDVMILIKLLLQPQLRQPQQLLPLQLLTLQQPQQQLLQPQLLLLP